MTPAKIEEVLEHFFGRVKERLHDPRMPTVRIPMLGTFKPSRNKLRKSLYACFMYLSKTKSTVADIKLIERIKKNWPVYRRLQQERCRVRKCRTSNFWQKVDPDNYPESYIDQYHSSLFEKGYVYDEMMPSAKYDKEANQRIIQNRKKAASFRKMKMQRYDYYLYKRDKEIEEEQKAKKVIPFWEK